jgi:SAM-dependent methyltransferase
MTIYRRDADAGAGGTEQNPNAWHEANRRGWDAVSPHWQQSDVIENQWRRCPAEPGLVLCPQELEYLAGIAGKSACVLGSGDNLVVFALAGLGARVTSVDISQAQLDIAAGRARELGLDITFVQADVSDLHVLADATFDVVYTGGHVAVWVSDLWRYYAEAVRVLKPGELFIVNEYHPFRRIWKYQEDRLEVDFGYFDRGPHAYDRSDEVPGAAPGSLPSYEFHWTVSDLVKAVMDAGCELVALREIGDQKQGWETPPVAGLPAYLLIIGRKPCQHELPRS